MSETVRSTFVARCRLQNELVGAHSYDCVVTSAGVASAVAFDAYPRVVIDHVLSEFEIAPGDLVVDVGCQLAVGLSSVGALVFALDPFMLPAKAVAAAAGSDAAPVHFVRGRAADLPDILVRELGPNIHPRVVSFGSAFRFMDQRAALHACDRCGAEGVALVFGTSAPSRWRASVADIVVDAAQVRVTARAGVKNEALAAIFGASAFSHLAKWQTELHLERSAEEVATLAALYALRAGIVASYASYEAMVSTIVARLRKDFDSSTFIEEVTYTVLSARRAHANRLNAYATTRGL
jgi:hypothetical protein